MDHITAAIAANIRAATAFARAFEHLAAGRLALDKLAKVLP